MSLSGFDGLIYSTGRLVGWPVVLVLIAEPLRNLGKYTFADVVSFRLKQTLVRIAAASGNFPALVLAVFWRRATTAGMVAAIIVGTLASLVFIYYSPTIQVDVLKQASTWFPLENPALVTMPLACAVGVVVSLLTPEKAALEAYDTKERRMILGAPAD